MSSGLPLLIKVNFFIILNVYYHTQIFLNNLIKLALGPFLIKYDHADAQKWKHKAIFHSFKANLGTQNHYAYFTQ